MTERMNSYLPEGLPIPIADADGLSTPYWEGLKEGRIRVQRCNACRGWQWGPEWICHRCHTDDIGWEEVPGKGVIYSWERPWHPVHPALKGFGPYLVVLVELPHAGGIRMIGNLLGDPHQVVRIGASVIAEFEHHAEAQPPFTLLQWRLGV
jgi:uncharacterized OB-fold protein